MLFRLRLHRAYRADRVRLAALIGLTAWLSLTLARGPGELAAIWAGNGILTGWLLSRRAASWPGYVAVAFLAELPARLFAGDGFGYAVAIALCNLVEALAVAGIVRSRIPDVRNPDDWLALGGIATMATVLACAGVGAMAARVVQDLHGQSFGAAWTGWFAAHVVGMVIMATATLVVQKEGPGVLIAPGRRWYLAMDAALVAVVGVAAFLVPYQLLFLT